MDVLPLVIEIVGWAAAVLILGAYVLLSLGRIEAQSYIYQWMNVFGAVGFIVNSGYNGAIPSAVLNIVWAGIGLFTLAMVWRSRKARSTAP
ncbi:MAG: CBU_0592 family membrane protein [Sphingopyxis sp.]